MYLEIIRFALVAGVGYGASHLSPDDKDAVYYCKIAFIVGTILSLIFTAILYVIILIKKDNGRVSVRAAWHWPVHPHSPHATHVLLSGTGLDPLMLRMFCFS
jgi:hypothetical protein